MSTPFKALNDVIQQSLDTLTQTVKSMKNTVAAAEGIGREEARTFPRLPHRAIAITPQPSSIDTLLPSVSYKN